MYRGLGLVRKAVPIEARIAVPTRPRACHRPPMANAPRRDRPASVRLALVMVGLPARGKTHIARRVMRYLSWLGYRTRVFNVGNYRRERVGSQMSHTFFDPTNPEGRAARAEVAMAALADMLAWFANGGEVGIYDATNSTRERRALVADRCRAQGLQVVFVESICEDETVIASNIRQTKLHMPDYVGMDPEQAVADFRARIAQYEKVYETVEEDEGSYVKLIDVGRKLVASGVDGFLPSRLVFFLMNIHTIPRPIYLSRHGESEYNVAHRIGGDSGLSPQGRRFAQNLARYVEGEVGEREIRIWTSTLRRTIETARLLGRGTVEWRALDEIDAGDCDGMTYDEIRAAMPKEFEARSGDKFDYRYPRGESYRDVIRRLEPVIVELERERSPVLIIAHQAILRALYAYLMDKPPRDCPHLSVPLHTLVKLTPATYGVMEERFELGPEPDRAEAPT
ncbi:6-phosphofructo-2-kinase/fructose-2, 6-bisphosphatase bifunctional enzyme [Sandaracinus amylolyticus]|nr:6-phosphofructo-2-kinase/fructose-2, 6-bisphosphatase bifunctional enzyme [Sandaracinus amylolyticus]